MFPSSDKRKAGPHSVGAILSTRNQRQMRVKLSKVIIQTGKNNLGEFSHDGIYVSDLKRFTLLACPQYSISRPAGNSVTFLPVSEVS